MSSRLTVHEPTPYNGSRFWIVTGYVVLMIGLCCFNDRLALAFMRDGNRVVDVVQIYKHTTRKNNRESRENSMSKKSVLIFSLAALVVVGAIVYRVMSIGNSLVPIPTINEDMQDKNAIAYKWQWENFTDKKSAPNVDNHDSNVQSEKPRLSGEVPYDVVMIYDILQSIHLDDYGRVIPDQTAKQALEKGFDDLGPNISAEAMAELQELIRIGLPGEAGEEAARVMKSYYEFRLAEEALNQQIQHQTPAMDHYERLVQLRRQYLGDEIANGLFAVDDAQARHMIATMAIQQNADLTDAEKQAEIGVLQEKLNNNLLALGELQPEEVAAEQVQRLRESGASNAEIYSTREEILGPVKAQELAAADQELNQWQNRFDGFWQARQNVMQAGLDDTEKERQIEQLLKQYFSTEELERARLTSLEWQSRDRN